ncbi:hypothetical protein V2J09_020506 [Rumex salicifolius]
MEEEEKVDLLLFHALPVYHRRCEFREEMGAWRLATVTSYYRGNGGFGESTVKMAAIRKLMIGVGYDDEGPLAVYPIRGVLLPDDPVGVMENLDPVAVPVKAKMGEDCVNLVFLAMSPAPEQSEVADSDLVEDTASLQLATSREKTQASFDMANLRIRWDEVEPVQGSTRRELQMIRVSKGYKS